MTSDRGQDRGRMGAVTTDLSLAKDRGREGALTRDLGLAKDRGMVEAVTRDLDLASKTKTSIVRVVCFKLQIW